MPEETEAEGRGPGENSSKSAEQQAAEAAKTLEKVADNAPDDVIGRVTVKPVSFQLGPLHFELDFTHGWARLPGFVKVTIITLAIGIATTFALLNLSPIKTHIQQSEAKTTAKILKDKALSALERNDYGEARRLTDEATKKIGAAFNGNMKVVDEWKKGVDELYEKEANSLSQDGFELMKKGDYEPAQANFEEALKILKDTFGTETVKAANMEASLSHCYTVRGNYILAKQGYDHALHVLNVQRGPKHSDVAIVLHYLGNWYHAQGHEDEAEKRLRDALKIAEKGLGKDSRVYADMQNDLGLILRSRSKYSDAEICHKKAIQIHTSIGDVVSVAGDEQNLANIYLRLEQYDKAEQAYKRALKIYIDERGEAHPSAARIEHNLGVMYYLQRKDEEAEVRLTHAWKTLRDVFGPAHIEVATIQKNLGLVCLARGKLKDAERRLRDASAAFRVPPDIDRHLLAETEAYLAAVYAKQGREDLAATTFNQAKELNDSLPLSTESDFPLAYDHYIDALKATGHAAEAESLEQRRRSELGEASPSKSKPIEAKKDR